MYRPQDVYSHKPHPFDVDFHSNTGIIQRMEILIRVHSENYKWHYKVVGQNNQEH